MKNQDIIAKKYKNIQFESASQIELMILLYQGAIDFLNKADQVVTSKDKRTKEDYQKIHHYLLRAQNIISEFMVSLNIEDKEEEITINLFKLYEYMGYRLSNVLSKREYEGIKEVKGLLLTLCSAWQSLAEKEKSGLNIDDFEGINLQG